MLDNKSALIFDFDGTLVDSMGFSKVLENVSVIVCCCNFHL